MRLHVGDRGVVLARSDPRYPTALGLIRDPPASLWVHGDVEALGAPAVAIVGSRAASTYAVDVGERLGADLAVRGVVVISGLARGVDAAAHRGALAVGGRTVAVLGSGVDVIYPAEHLDLARDIVGAGALVSELAPGTPPRPGHFPLRNRIISGLSLAVVVVEASEKSGSLITARYGLDQGREVMAVPGNVLSGRSRGGHALLKDGAKVVEGVDDILEELGHWPSAANSSQTGGSLKDQTDPVTRVMAEGESYELDALIDLTGVAAPRLLPRLLQLELDGRIRRVSGGRFVRV
jgi:DNA processing protein